MLSRLALTLLFLAAAVGKLSRQHTIAIPHARKTKTTKHAQNPNQDQNRGQNQDQNQDQKVVVGPVTVENQVAYAKGK